MIRRTVEISREPSHLAVRHDQLLILRRDESRHRLPANPANLAGQIPLEDLGVLVVDERDTTYTQSVLIQLAEHGAALVVCGPNHLPCGMFLPLSTNTELLGRLEMQLAASKPRRKRLWADIVTAKIRAQAANLEHAPQIRSQLLSMARRVRSGDPDNMESQAARLYWPVLFDDLSDIDSPFRRRPRDPDSQPPNQLLNYGYAVVRATVARAVVSAGLLPALGIKHHHRSNPFCLADDLMEPLRPLVDARARALVAQGALELNTATKVELLKLLTETLRIGDTTGPLGVVVVVRYIASFVRVLSGEASSLEVPVALFEPCSKSDTELERHDECT